MGCGEYYHGGDIAAVVTEPSRSHRAAALPLVRTRPPEIGRFLDSAAPVEVDPISADEVLDCHDLLAGAARPPSELFAAFAA